MLGRALINKYCKVLEQIVGDTSVASVYFLFKLGWAILVETLIIDSYETSSPIDM